MKHLFFDLGAHNGDSIVDFYENRSQYRSRHNPHAYTTYAFEPNAAHLKLKERFTAYKHPVNIIPEAAWISDGSITFKNAPESLSSCVEQFTMQSYDESQAKLETLKCIDFPSFLADKARAKDTYVVIKMDIESSEYTIIPILLEKLLFKKIDEFYVEFHHTYPDWELVRRNLIEAIIKQNPAIYLEDKWA